MIEAIRDIGEYAVKKEGKNVDNPLDIIIDNPESNPRNPLYKLVLIIYVEKNELQCIYKMGHRAIQ